MRKCAVTEVETCTVDVCSADEVSWVQCPQAGCGGLVCIIQFTAVYFPVPIPLWTKMGQNV